MLSAQAFDKLCKAGFTHIPLVREIPAGNRHTPLSIYQQTAHIPYTYLLESAESIEHWGRYSFIGFGSTERIEVYGDTLRLMHGAHCQQETHCPDPLAWIDTYLKSIRTPPTTLKFSGGLVGYFGYESIGYIENKLKTVLFTNKHDDLKVPDILLLISNEIAVYDRQNNTVSLVVNAQAQWQDAYSHAQQRLDALEALLQAPTQGSNTKTTIRTDEDSFSSQFGQEKYCQAVEKVHEYIAAGDVMQVVLSQRLSAPFDGNPYDCYRHLRRINPSPYMYYFNLGQFYIVGSSPEVLVCVEDKEATLRPIAGTRPRSADEVQNQRLEAELVKDEKELAEHLMLVDLGRNDLGRVCSTGSVKVKDNMVLERYSHVVHLVSHLVGRVRDGMSVMDVLRATFPAGTVSGAPKIRAMEIISELESVKRGIYSGAVGYISWGGAMDLAIAIRTLIVCQQILYAQAGAGLVYDSKPTQEWRETMSKARVLLRAATLSSQA